MLLIAAQHTATHLEICRVGGRDRAAVKVAGVEAHGGRAGENFDAAGLRALEVDMEVAHDRCRAIDNQA